ncbi:MAG: nucleotide sugar dehydrogenase [Thermoplasmata archaeon]|nr:nucleotide sugar dehydrogenase [Thermoplasmata archaeon]
MTRKIAVIGMGYVGIPAAALLADVEGLDVTGVQRRSKRSGWKIEVLNSGKSPIEGYEPGLEELIHRVVVEKKSFRVTDDISIVRDMDTILIDVQTPTDEDKTPHYFSLKEVSASIGKYMKPGTLVIIESTVAPGTTLNIVQPLLEQNSGLKAGKDFGLAFSYERVMPGKLIEYIVDMPRVVGGIDKESTERAVELYRKIVRKEIHATDILTAEVSKTVENAFRDVNIAFANEIALICESMGVNVYEIRDYINERHDRNMHIPGAGVGGHCLPKDTWLLRHGLKTYGHRQMEPEMITLARNINDFMPYHMVELTEEALKGLGKGIKGAKIAVLGVAYLEDSDDVRNTPATPVIDALKLKGAIPAAHDPNVRPREYEVHPVVKDLDSVLQGADAALIITKHREYLDLDFSRLKGIMRTPVLIDGRNIYSKKDVEAHGFVYNGIGKGN